MTNSSGEYSTDRMALAAMLLYLGFKLVALRLNKKDAMCIEYVFDKDEIVGNLIERYWEGASRTEPKKIFARYEELKERVVAELTPHQEAHV